MLGLVDGLLKLCRESHYVHIAYIGSIDPCLTDPRTSPDNLIILDKSRAGKGPPYRSSPSPGKGIGLFATEFIPKGTTIFKEKTVLTCPTQGRLDARDLQNIFDQVARLSPHLQAGILSLSGQVPVLAPRTPLMVYYRALLRQDVFYADGSRMAWREYSKLEKVIRVFYTNAAAVYKSRSRLSFWKPMSVGDGLFLTFSRMNHSCEPNADWDTCHSPGTMSVWAGKDIRPNEEITITYIGGIDQPVEKRRKRLAQWGFVCQCTKCGAIPRDEK